MKVNEYKLKMLENGNGMLTVYKGVNEIEVCEVKGLDGLTAEQMTERALLELKTRDIELVKDYKENYMVDQKVDLSLVRLAMRDVLKTMRNKDLTIEEKKQLLPIAQQTCASAQIMVNTCKMELAIDVFNKGKK